MRTVGSAKRSWRCVIAPAPLPHWRRQLNVEPHSAERSLAKSIHDLCLERNPAHGHRTPSTATAGNCPLRHEPTRKAATVLRLRQREVGLGQGGVRSGIGRSVWLRAAIPATAWSGRRLRPGLPIAAKTLEPPVGRQRRNEVWEEPTRRHRMPEGILTVSSVIPINA